MWKLFKIRTQAHKYHKEHLTDYVSMPIWKKWFVQELESTTIHNDKRKSVMFLKVSSFFMLIISSLPSFFYISLFLIEFKTTPEAAYFTFTRWHRTKFRSKWLLITKSWLSKMHQTSRCLTTNQIKPQITNHKSKETT